MYHAFLHPDAANADLNRRIDDFRHEQRAPKYIHDINGQRDILQPNVAFFAEHFGFVRVDRNDPVAGRLQILSHAVTRSHAPARKPHDSDRFPGLEDLRDGVGFGEAGELESRIKSGIGLIRGVSH